MANTLIWTVIPVAVKNGKHPIVAVYLSARLGAPPSGAAAPTLDMYPDFKDWPATVANNISFKLNIYPLESNQPLASMETKILSQPDSKMWKSLFPQDTPVTANPDPKNDGRLKRNYESYSVRKSSEYVRNGYLAVAATSAQQAQTSQLSARRFRALLAAVPPPIPTAEEVAGHFASSNLFLPQSPTEPEKQDQRITLEALSNWVRAEEGPGVRHQIQSSVAGYLGRLAPGATANAGNGVMALFKADVIRRVVDRAVKQANQTGPTWPNPPAEANHSARFAAIARVASLGDTMSLDDHLDRAHFHRAMVGPSDRAQCEPHDFHQLLSMLGSHPLLYSHAGVVFDLLGQAELPSSDRARLSVEVTFTNKLAQTPVHYFPRTAYQIFEKSVGNGTGSTKLFFLPCSRKNGSAQARAKRQSQEDAINMGILDLSDSERFHLETMDTHGDYFKTAKLDPTGTPESPAQPDRGAALPKLRSCGLALARADRTQKIEAAATTNAGHFEDMAKPNSTTFYAEDLTVGYRIDVCVFPDPANDRNRKLWKSLCLRNTTWDLAGPDGKPWTFKPRVDGECKSTSQDDGTANMAEYNRLECRRFEGIVHSGSTQAIDTDPSKHQVMETMFRWENWSLSVPVPVKNRPEPPIDSCATGLLRMRAKQKIVNHSLPPLRYGWGYYVRCRAAFLDGSGLSLEDCNDSDSKIGDNGQPFIYYRIESVDTPSLLLSRPLKPKTSPGEQMNFLVVRGNEITDRVVIPPRVSPYLAYLHGKFDPDEEGAFVDYIWNQDGTFATVAQYNGHKRPGSLDEQNAIFVKRDQNQLELIHPYFPDPAADCARINLIHRRTNKSGPQTETFEFYSGINGWPDARPFVLSLNSPDVGQEADAALSWAGTTRGWDTLSIGLKKGRTAKLVLSSCLLPTKKRSHSLGPLFRFFHGLHSHVNPFLATNGHSATQPDMHWLLASQTEVQLVHAVEKPLQAPSFTQLFLKKDEIQGAAGNSSVTLHSQIQLDADSTAKADISARWTDDVDDTTTRENNQESSDKQPAKPGITERSTSMHVQTMPVQLQEFEQTGENAPEFRFNHNLGDTKYHLVTYSVSGTSRFSSHYTAEQSDKPDRFIAQDHAHDRVVCIPNRARPEKPKILYLIPSFRWDDDEIKHGRIHHRWGGGIRVYIDRGWFSSGNGELLGVLLAEGAVPESARDLCTQMGSDPLWQGPSVPATPGVKDLKGFAGFVRCFRPGQDCTQECEETSLSGLTIQEQDGFKVTAVGYTPQFDAERQLWYCDLVLSPKNAYYPFVRFALARFQPNSIDAVHLSNVVTADFIQLAPDRWVVLQKEKHHVTVTVYGYAYSASSASAAGSKIVFTVEERISGMNNELCWIPATDPQTKRLLTQTAQAEPVSKLGKSKGRESKVLDIPADGYAWHQEFDLPHRGFAVHRRLLIQEVETFESDDRAQGKTINDKKLCDRVVFADIVQI